ncbi:MAG: ABC transporter substrate-binding protein [Bacteroidales bacterium]|nr:ABC transporter substrate-binding protein [Bacteroidales bacterium]MCM1415299.1 ABC transporter substrate-binding protein [bacterium]MCM1423455.1 ABC transporter substrate-binding protein [bacterium]
MKKKTTTRITALLLGMLLCMMTACGGQAAPAAESETPVVETAETEAPAAESTETEEPDVEPAATEAEAQSALPTTDPSGAAITIPEQVDTVIALAPSICETLVALGEGEKLVGYDLQSVGLEGLPESVPTFDTVNPDVEQLTALAPDMLLVSSLSLYDQEAPYQPLIDAGVCVICVPTSVSIENVRSDIRFLAAALSVPEEGERVVAEMDAELDRLSAMVSDIPEEEKKSVYFEISPAPYLYSTGSGTYLHEMIELAGGKNVLADQSDWIAVEGESVVAANPDVIFTNVNYTDAPVEEILGREGWAGISAVTNQDVYYIDNMASSLPNQNIVKAVDQMVQALYPERYAAQ